LVVRGKILPYPFPYFPKDGFDRLFGGACNDRECGACFAAGAAYASRIDQENAVLPGKAGDVGVAKKGRVRICGKGRRYEPVVSVINHVAVPVAQKKPVPSKIKNVGLGQGKPVIIVPLHKPPAAGETRSVLRPPKVGNAVSQKNAGANHVGRSAGFILRRLSKVFRPNQNLLQSVDIAVRIGKHQQLFPVHNGSLTDLKNIYHEPH
jgi:hypothetical protein